MEGQIQVFIKMDMSGRGTATITISPDATVSDLIAKIKDREGAQDVRLNFRTKPLVETRKLSDYEITHGSTIFCSLRMLGGAQVPKTGEGSARMFDPSKASKYGVSAVKEECKIFLGNSCDNAGIPKARFPCNHVICSDCAFIHFERAVKTNGRTDVPCCYTCPAKLNIDALFVVAGLTENEIKDFEDQLGINVFGNNICPNSECGIFLYDGGIAGNRVQCSKCKSDFYCKRCKQSWKTANNDTVCGNAGCDSHAQLFEVLINCGSKSIPAVNGETPVTRLCPNCTTINEHIDRCKHMTCHKCKTQYCHGCLKIWGNECNNSKICNPAPLQIAK